MKKILFGIFILLILLTAVYFVVVRQNKEKEMPKETPKVENNYSEEIINPEIESKGKMDKQLEEFEKELKDINLDLTNKATKDAESIGAIEGYSFDVNGVGLEMYYFDLSSKNEKSQTNLKTAREEGFITIFGAEINGKELKPKCAINDALIIIFPTEDFGMAHPNKDAIVQAFMNI